MPRNSQDCQTIRGSFYDSPWSSEIVACILWRARDLQWRGRWHNEDLCSSAFKSLHKNAQNQKFSILLYPQRHYWRYVRAEILKKSHWEPRHEWKQKPLEGAGATESCWWPKNKIKDKGWWKARIPGFPYRIQWEVGRDVMPSKAKNWASFFFFL